jgi:hypothetical protein
MAFVKATKKQARARIGLIGPSGSGKTYTSLRVATELAGPDGRIAVIDSERGSASKYAGIFNFDVCELETFSPDAYVRAIHDAENAGYDVIVVDSLTHAWSGKEGALEQVDKAAARSKMGNSFAAWREVTPMHNNLVDALVGSKCHLIATMRSKTEYVLEKDERTGKTVPRKIGMAPIQRDGMEYEFDVFGDMDHDNTLVITKSRCPKLTKAVIKEPGEDFAKTLKAWLTDGAPMPEPVQPATDQPKASPKTAALNGIRQWSKMPKDEMAAAVRATIEAAVRESFVDVGLPLAPDLKLTDEQWQAVSAFVTDCMGNGIEFTRATTPATQETAV